MPKFPSLAKIRGKKGEPSRCTESAGNTNKTKQVTLSKFFFSPKVQSKLKQNCETTSCTDDGHDNGFENVNRKVEVVASSLRKRNLEDSSKTPSSFKKQKTIANSTEQYDSTLANSESALPIPGIRDINHDVLEQKKLSCSTIKKLDSFALSAQCSVEGKDISIDSLKNKLNSNNNPDIDFENEDVAIILSSDEETEARISNLSKCSFTNMKSQTSQSHSKLNKSKGVTGAKYTPLEQQFMDIKRQHSDVLLLVECGYKYRFFGEDAEVASKELNIYCHLDHNFMTASIPTHRLFVHVRRLVAVGHKVGVVKQTETAALKAASSNKSAPFTRELTAMYTKATLIGEDVNPMSSDLSSDIIHGANDANTYLMAVHEVEKQGSDGGKYNIGIVAVQPSTGDIIYDSFEDDKTRSALETRVSHIEPVELLLPDMLSNDTERLVTHLVSQSLSADDRLRIERISKGSFDYKEALPIVSKFYSAGTCDKGTVSVEELVNLPIPVVGCLSALISYLTDFKLERVLKLTSNMKKFTTEKTCMHLNACTLRNLEIFKNSTNQKEHGSLYWVLNHTQTRFGSRQLRTWIAKPLLQKSAIEARQNAVSELLTGNSSILTEARAVLSHIPDVDRGICTILHKKCSTAEFLTVVTVKALSKVFHDFSTWEDMASRQLQSDLLKEIFTEIPQLLQGIDVFATGINEKAAIEKDKTNLFVDETKFPEVLARKQEILDVKSSIHSHRREIRLQLKMPALEYATVSGLEYLVEVKNNNLKLVPNNWTKVSMTKAVSRFHTPFIAESVKKLNQLREQLEKDCLKAWMQFLDSFACHYQSFHKAVHHLATLDCLYSLAQVAKQQGYVRPSIVDDASLIHIKQGRHPVVDLLMNEQEQYVPNDTEMKSTDRQCMIITGPNMGGKSSYIRQVALISIMAQVGSYVPAEEACLGIVDAVFTRMGASDDIYQHRSTFMVELQEASEIMSQATSQSLVILDELGRGTSTHDGVAIAYATLKYFIEKVGCLTLFVTHYPSLAELEHLYPGRVSNHHMGFLLNDEVEDPKNGAASVPAVTFLYQLVDGMAARSYGLNVAKLADIPENILTVACSKSRDLEEKVTKSGTELDQFKLLFGAKEDSAMLPYLKIIQDSDAIMNFKEKL